MLNRDESNVNSLKEVLKAFIISSKPVYKKYKILTGYGLRKSDFHTKSHFGEKEEKMHDATPKKFETRKKALLKSSLIKHLESKSKKDVHYGITPLGIVEYVNLTEKLDITTFDYIMTFLKKFYELGKHDDEISYIEQFAESWSTLTKIIGEEELLRIFKSVCIIDLDPNWVLDYTSIFYCPPKDKKLLGKDYCVSCDKIIAYYETENNLRVPIIHYLVGKNKKGNIVGYESKKTPYNLYLHGSNEKEFNYNISKFLLHAFAFAIFEKLDRKLYLINGVASQPYLQLVQRIKKIPIGIRGMALEFSGILNKSIMGTSLSTRHLRYDEKDVELLETRVQPTKKSKK